jgi:hypothetical protein
VSEPAARLPASSALAVEASAALSAADEPTAGTTRQPRPTEGGPAFAAVVAGRAVQRQECGPLKPKVNGSGSPEAAASSEVDFRCMSIGDVSGPLRGMSAGTTPDTPMDTTTFPQASGKRRFHLRFKRDEYPWLLGMVEGVVPQRSLGTGGGGEIYARTKDGRLLSSHNKCAAVP